MNRTITLIISGSIAAYKSLELIRRLRERGCAILPILTQGGAEFITPLSVASLSGSPVYGDLFSLKDEAEMGHIRLARQADLILVAPASADIIAKMVQGRADDLATATLLAADVPVMVAPAMNTKMWEHAATKRNLTQLKKDGALLIEPGSGELACGETGAGRFAETDAILSAIENFFAANKPLRGRRALVTAGPTYEAIDPVRFIGNRSSGKQGYAIAEALADAGASVTLISGPTSLPAPKYARRVEVETAAAMMRACEDALPVDIAVFAAAVADWQPEHPSARKLKKRDNETPPAISLKKTPDILSSVAHHKHRPSLVIGFAAETESLEKNAVAKRRKKGCDWLLANDVSDGKVFNKDETRVLFVTAKGADAWPAQSKTRVAKTLTNLIAQHCSKPQLKVAK